jgi:TPR repeat protein
LVLLSDCYAHGYGVPVQFEEALKYLQLAASAGSASAQTVLPRIMAALIRSGQIANETFPTVNNSTLTSLSSSELKLIEHALIQVPDNEYYSKRWKEANEYLAKVSEVESFHYRE